MTLIVTVNGPETIWLLADRRLSSRGHKPRDDARKVMILNTSDGVAVLGYAGLGATAAGSEPADWMSSVLRGRKLPLERSLAVLAEAMKDQFPPHMVRMPRQYTPAHCVLVPAFVENEARLYTIDMRFALDRKGFWFRYSRRVVNKPAGRLRVPRMMVAGSGEQYLGRDKGWIRPLLRLIRAHDRRQVSSDAVAAHLAGLNLEVHLGTRDGSVGPRCIVAWRNRKGGIHKGGGACQFFDKNERERTDKYVPEISNGRDIIAVIEALTPGVMMGIKSGRPTSEWDWDATDAKLARLPTKPDEKLR